MEPRYEEFLKELTELTRKHRLKIWGCECCGSPSVDPVDEKELTADYQYHYPNDGVLVWKKE